jgi:hypothetical protein
MLSRTANPERTADPETRLRRRRLRAVSRVLADCAAPANVLVRAYFEQHRAIAWANRLLQDARTGADPAQTRAVLRCIHEQGLLLSLPDMAALLEPDHTRAERKRRGTVYTPSFVVEYICRRVAAIRSDAEDTRTVTEWRVFDPAVGAGSFLLGMAEHLHQSSGARPSDVLRRQLYGHDIAADAVETARLLLNLWALSKGDDVPHIPLHLHVADSLLRAEGERTDDNAEWNHANARRFGVEGGFDAVIGNPPYVRVQNLDPPDRERVRAIWRTARRGNIDLYIPFIELGLEEVSNHGVVGYILPSSFTTTEAGRALRRLLGQRGAIVEMYDFGHHQVFDGVTTYTCLLFLSRRRRERFLYATATHADHIPAEPAFSKVSLARLNPQRWQLVPGDLVPTLRALEGAGRPLGRIARIGAGIATLADDCYLLPGDRTDDGYIKQTAETTYVIEPDLTRPILKASRLKTEADIHDNRERILFPYTRDDGKHRIIPEDELADRYPRSYAYLCAVRERLDRRDRGRPNAVAWYAFGRSQGLDTNFGRKLLTSGVNRESNFLLSDDEATTFYAGYCVQTSAEDLRVLQRILNSPLLDLYIQATSRVYRGGYRSFAKAFLRTFSIPFLSAAERELLLRETDPHESVAVLLHRYGIRLDMHPALAAFLRESRKMRRALPAYPATQP